jgi:murein DD-endopeptidase MepM/ murein hydrolase activator NlpD
MKLLKPWPEPHKIRSGYGNRKHPISGRTKKHRGVDVAYSGLIYAPGDGVVVHKGANLNKRTGGGYTLIVKHTPKLFTVYYHLREPSSLAVGARVALGDVLGHTGTTGASTGVHLHWETRKSRRWGSDFDPHTVTDMSRSAADGATPSQIATPKLVEDGILGRNTWSAVQRFLQAEGHHKGRINGVPGKTTIRGLQQWLNEVL